MVQDRFSDFDRREAAARWHAELQDPDVDERIWQAFRAWEQADPANAAAYQEIEAALVLLDQSSLADRWPVLPRRPRLPRLLLAGAALAAVLAAALFAVTAASPGYELRPVIHVTEIGERADVTLADGSRIHLNTDTQIEILFSQQARRLHLVSGQALFEVAPGPRPFIVEAGETETIAHGTLFDIYRREEGVRIALREGAVSVTQDHAAPILLHPGQQALARPGQPPQVTEIDPARIGQWQSGTLAFDNVTLAEAVAEMNRYATTRIEIADPALAAERISGVFPAGEQESFAEALALYLPLKAEGKGGRIVLMRADVRAD